MSTDFDRSVEELEQQVIEQARAFYSAKVVEEFYNPKNVGRMREPDACGLVHGWCGDTMEIYLRLKEERIEQAWRKPARSGRKACSKPWTACPKKTPTAPNWR